MGLLRSLRSDMLSRHEVPCRFSSPEFVLTELQRTRLRKLVLLPLQV